MAFPEIRSCVICEDARPELLGKFTLLGFYGIAPNVEIRLREFDRVVERLVFFLLAAMPSEPGAYKVRPDLVGPDGKSLFEEARRDVDIALRSAPGGQYMVGFGFANIPFRRPGTHTFVLRVDGAVHYTTAFEVAEGRAEDFA